MNRLQLELQRLYLTQPSAGLGEPASDLGRGEEGVSDPGVRTSSVEVDAIDTSLSEAMIDADGQVRALVLELARPADWSMLSAVWNAVQADLELPAPAIAVNGRDAYQLWFSLARPVPATQAHVLLDALRRRYLADVTAVRITLLPAVDAVQGAGEPAVRHADLVPALQPARDVWSAFLAPDLAPMFADEPWLDMPPSIDGQAKLLARLACIQPAELERALALLGAMPEPARPGAGMQSPADTSPATSHQQPAPAASTGAHPAPIIEPLDPRRFLQGVMADASVPLALRIEAAKALLPYTEQAR